MKQTCACSVGVDFTVDTEIVVKQQRTNTTVSCVYGQWLNPFPSLHQVLVMCLSSGSSRDADGLSFCITGSLSAASAGRKPVWLSSNRLNLETTEPMTPAKNRYISPSTQY